MKKTPMGSGFLKHKATKRNGRDGYRGETD